MPLSNIGDIPEYQNETRPDNIKCQNHLKRLQSNPRKNQDSKNRTNQPPENRDVIAKKSQPISRHTTQSIQIDSKQYYTVTIDIYRILHIESASQSHMQVKTDCYSKRIAQIQSYCTESCVP